MVKLLAGQSGTNKLQYSPNTLQLHYITATLHYSHITLQSHYITVKLHYSQITLHYCLITLQLQYITLQLQYIAVIIHFSNITIQIHYITVTLHYRLQSCCIDSATVGTCTLYIDFLLSLSLFVPLFSTRAPINRVLRLNIRPLLCVPVNHYFS